jgi:hypothetical protein
MTAIWMMLTRSGPKGRREASGRNFRSCQKTRAERDFGAGNGKQRLDYSQLNPRCGTWHIVLEKGKRVEDGKEDLPRPSY